MKNNQITVAILTVSDRAHRGERFDKSGPALSELLESNDFIIVDYKIVPDETEEITFVLSTWVEEKIPLIFTTGGTGFSPRDITPEATLSLIDKETPGISEFLRYKSFQITPHASLSRGVSGIKGNSLIINLPGSPKAAKECVEFLLPVLPHAIELMLQSPGSEENH
ncbi:MAG: MogA/MoaB family molybdenum cofactor biosynthesis protein [Anaerolineaceae bacterium]|nr:MogA/MoaB family molybdenum cofactor biosynthesis protein [Anaerolineaceae bacterium]